jgi:hypothetical protein
METIAIKDQTIVRYNNPQFEYLRNLFNPSLTPESNPLRLLSTHYIRQQQWIKIVFFKLLY